MSDDLQYSDFESVKNRLDEIAKAVVDESMSLDDALSLYEEAVSLGLQASDLLESGIVVSEDIRNSEDADKPNECVDVGEISLQLEQPEQPEQPVQSEQPEQPEQHMSTPSKSELITNCDAE